MQKKRSLIIDGETILKNINIIKINKYEKNYFYIYLYFGSNI